MKHRYIGKSGLRVSPICMGTMSFGSWSDKAESFKICEKSYDRGINFFDTAEVYPVPPRAETVGRTEEIFGEWLKTKPRDSVIVATKVAGAAAGWIATTSRLLSKAVYGGWILTTSICIRFIGQTLSFPWRRRWKRWTDWSSLVRCVT